MAKRKSEPPPALPKAEEVVIPVAIEEEMKSSYIDYAMSVIVGRALPDVRDGLKPAHRRILHAMNELGVGAGQAYKKSARIVGEVLGKYHPHGDVAVYDTLVRMAQDFALRYPLVDGQGNFGSIDGDSPAAMRYTEARLSRIAEEMLADIDEETVDWAPNFDGSLREPLVLPGRLPNLLVNGSSGIAVGVTTNMPPHNLGEIVGALGLYLDNTQVTAKELMAVVRGPDFPTGGIIHGKAGIREAYETGRGIIRVRAKANIEEDKRGRPRIVVTEIPYQVNKTTLLEAIADLVRDKKVEGISDLRDESDRDGMRVVVELKADANAEIVLNQLFKHTQMETTFGIINLALVGGEPRVLPLRDLLQQFVDHRRQVIRRRTQFRLAKAEKRAHIVEGLRTAISKLDQTIALIKKSRSPEEARGALMEKMSLSEEQANAILEMRLSRLTGLEREKLEQEYEELRKTIARLKKILASEKEILGLIREELGELKSKYGDERRTRIVERTVELGVEDLIAQEEMVVSITHGGYIKRLPVDSFRRQRRGGKGIVGMETKEEDFVRDIFVANTHDHLLFFSNLGKVYWLKTYEVPQAGRHAKGKAIINLIKVSPGERITASIPVHEFDDKRYLFFATRQGTAKKTRLDAFSNPRSSGIRAMGLRGGDELEDVKLTDGKREIILATRLGQAVRFHEEEVRDMGRGAAGVRGIRVSRGDRVISLEVVDPKNILLAITEKGYGKRTAVEEYRKTARGGKGVINVKVTDKTGPVVSILNVTDEDEIILMSSKGQTIRTFVKQISLQGRATQGVRVMNLEASDRVVAAEKVIEEGNGEE